MCEVTDSYVRYDSFICARWFIHMCDMTHWQAWRDSMVRVTWLVDKCRGWATTRAICATWLIHVRYGSFTCATWRIGHDTFTGVVDGHQTEPYMTSEPYLQSHICHAWLCLMPVHDTIFTWHQSHICRAIYATGIKQSHICDMTHSYVQYDSFICATWLIGHDS